MPPVVFRGGGSRPNNADQGNLLFTGISFFLSHYVPSAAHFRDLIRHNGGTIEKSEQHAQIFLTDHKSKKAAQSAPPKAVSYTFVDKSLKEGQLEDLNHHLISVKVSIPARPRTSRAVGSSTSVSTAPRIGRNNFTAIDDNILYTFISRPGVKLNGNAIYQQIANLYPQHTMHSWRDRWVRVQSKFHPNGPPLPPADFVLPNSVARESASPSPPPSIRQPRRLPVARNERSEQSPQSPPRQRQRRQPTQQPTPIKMEPKPVPLAPKDEKILQRRRDELMSEGLDLYEISENLEEEYPHHTSEEWITRIKIFIKAERNKKRKLDTVSFSPTSIARSRRMEELERERAKARKWVRREAERRDEIAETEDEAEQIPKAKGKGRAVDAPDNEDEESTQSASPSPEPSPEPQKRKRRRQERLVTPDDDLDIKEELVTPKLRSKEIELSQSYHKAPKTTSQPVIEEAQAKTADPTRKSSKRLSGQSAEVRLGHLENANDTPPQMVSADTPKKSAPLNKATEMTASNDLVDNVIRIMDGLPEDTPDDVIDFIRVSINKEIASRRASSGVLENQETKSAEAQGVAQASKSDASTKGASSPSYRPPTPSKPQSSMPPPATTPLKSSKAVPSVTPSRRTPSQTTRPQWRVERRIDSRTAKTNNAAAGPSSTVIDLTHKMSLSEPRVKYIMCNNCGAKVKEDEIAQHKSSASCTKIPASSPPPRRHVGVQIQETEKVSWGARFLRETFDAVFGIEEVVQASGNPTVEEAEREPRGGTPSSSRNQHQSPAPAVRPPSTVISETPMLPKKQPQLKDTQTPIKSSGNSIVYETSPAQAISSSMRTDKGHHSRRLASQMSVPEPSRVEVPSSPVGSYKRQKTVTKETEVIMTESSPESEVGNQEQEGDESVENTSTTKLFIEQTKSIVLEEQVGEVEEDEEDDEDSGKIALSDDEDEDDLVSQLGGSQDFSEDAEELVSQLGQPDSPSQGDELITQLRTQRYFFSESEEGSGRVDEAGPQEIDRQIQNEQNDYDMQNGVQEEDGEEEDEEDEEEEEFEIEDEEMEGEEDDESMAVADFQQLMSERYGINVEFIVYALERTSMDQDLAERLLRIMVTHCPQGGREGDFPFPNEPGIFTEEEDDILRETDEDRREQLEEKHGYDLYRKRMDFLDAWDDSEEEENGGDEMEE